MTVNHDSVVPVYEQLASLLREQIEDGTRSPGRRVPSESDLCHDYGVSRDTVRAAMRVLRQEDLVVTRAGKGTYVVEVKK